jgi:hypothetical protein
MSEGTDASIESINGFGMALPDLLTTFTAGIDDAVQGIGNARIGASGLAEGNSAAAYHAFLVQSAGELIGDVARGVSSLSAGAVTIASNYRAADAQQQSEMTTVQNAFDPHGGPTVAGQMAEARAAAQGNEDYATQLRTTGDGTLPAPTTTGPAERTAAQAAEEQVRADNEKYGQDEHQNWWIGRDDLVDAPEPEQQEQPAGYNPYAGGYHLGG